MENVLSAMILLTQYIWKQFVYSRLSLKSELCHGTVLTLSAVIIPVSDQMMQTNCHQSQWQNSGKISTRQTILEADGSHL